MSGTINRHERQRPTASRQTGNLAIHFPLAQWLRPEFVLSAPLQCECHAIISHLRDASLPISQRANVMQA